MNRCFGVLLVGLLAAAAAQAHFPFLVPEADGTTARLIFSDTLKPDTDVNIEKLANTKLYLRKPGSKDVALEAKKGTGCYEVKLPSAGPRTIFGVTEYGVLQKGDAKPFRLVYFPKALLDDAPREPLGEPLKVEIVPVETSGKVRFQVLQLGKPAAGIEATVLPPEGDKQAAKTDKEGFTAAFSAKGRYGVFARITEAKSGEFAGKKYEETRFYATLVIDVK